MTHFYGVKFLNKILKSFVIIHQFFQLAKFLNNMDITLNKYSSTNFYLNLTGLCRLILLESLVGGFLQNLNCEDYILKKSANKTKETANAMMIKNIFFTCFVRVIK